MSAEKPATAVEASEAISRYAFEQSIAGHGLVLSQAEADGVFQLANWMSAGLADVETAAADVQAAADAALDLPLVEQGARLRDGRLTSVDLVEAYLRRIDKRDPIYRAFYVVDREGASAAARRADAAFAAGSDLGFLHGIPVGIKDLIDVKGLATTANAPGRKDAIAQDDAQVVKRLRAAGAVIMGKLATYEWGTVGPDRKGLLPPARNPWSLEHITGGSSSGSAVAAAGGLLRTTLGTDTGGSLRGPAFYCGVVGLKPTFGLVPNEGVLPMSDSMDHIGPMSATVAEAAMTLDVIADLAADRSAARYLGQTIAGKRIGYARNWFARDHQTMPAVLMAMDAAVSTLSQLGALIEEIELPDYPVIEVASAAVLHRESFDLHVKSLRENPADFGRRAFLSLAAGVAITDEQLAAARGAGKRFRSEIDALFGQYDAIVTVGALTTALLASPFEEEAVWTPMRTIGFNISGHPVLALPIGFDGGLPMGMQIVGRHYEEATIVQIGDAFERATDFSLQRPPAIA